MNITLDKKFLHLIIIIGFVPFCMTIFCTAQPDYTVANTTNVVSVVSEPQSSESQPGYFVDDTANVVSVVSEPRQYQGSETIDYYPDKGGNKRISIPRLKVDIKIPQDQNSNAPEPFPEPIKVNEPVNNDKIKKPNTFPPSGSQSVPIYNNPPSASSGQSFSYLFHGQKPSMEDLRSIGGDLAIGNGLQFFILYNNKWCQQYTSYWNADRTNTLLFIDQPQYISYCEKYPDGKVARNDVGYADMGYFPGWFEGDSRGWHEIAVWGSKSGWSNILEIYVQ